MNILHIDTPDTWRGGQAQVFHLIEHLSDHDVTNHLLTPESSELAERARERNLPTTLHHHPLRGEWDLGAAWRISSIAEEQEIDLLHAHDSNGHGICWLASVLFTLPPLIVTRRLERPVGQNWFSQKKYALADRYIAISESVKSALVECDIPAERITVIPSGIDLEEIESTPPEPSILESLGVNPERPVIGNVGALTEQKDQKTFVAAAANVLYERPDAQFVIAGKGDLREDLESQIRDLGVEENVTLAGFQENIIGLIKTFDLFVLTSIFEGLCSTLLQVMACRVPIVATDVGGVPELIEHEETGLLTPPETPEQTAEAVIRFLENDHDEFNAFSETAYERVRSYDYPSLAKRTAELYEQTLANRS